MRPNDPTDADLVARARAGDTGAFAQLYDRHRDPVTHFLTRFVGDRHLAEDLTQEAFVSAMRNLASLRRPARFRPWLFSIAHRGALDHIRRGGPVLLADLPDLVDAGDHPAEAATATEATRLVWDAAASLEPRQLAILELTLRDDLTTPELAHALDVSTAHAAVLAHRSRSALANAVRMLLLARDPAHCQRLAAMVPTRPRALTRSQRVSVDRHLRRCQDCRELVGRLTAPLAVLAVLLSDPAPSVEDPAWALVDPRSHLARKVAVTAVLTLGLTVAVSLSPHSQIPPDTAPPVVTTTTAIPAVTTSEPSPAPTTTTRPPIAPPAVSSAPAVARPASEPSRLVAELNDRRLDLGCRPLQVDSHLTTAAQRHSADMATGDYIGVKSPSGVTVSDRAQTAGYPGMVGAFVAASRETADDLMPLLSDSPALTCGTRSIGTARAVGGSCGFYWTLLYGAD
ncbi:sigma-70 family RNA polymerase sigma factor [Actinokineospora terrae]|uniref:RNA polymerase sigma factor n=1 Tax=Actinokineospora terrae TaxID=155974 RepID=A0A1H9WUN3_9PSEU|nr:sigma-70 family RNA polymerase sigma factor [Actinokineospora terrae]SES37407.1 RNA polymerase sigma factor, sigma-70 family [Actinokineospora terrae]